MSLSKEHITQLYTFTQRHFVEWYDLQTELVDHLANDIESICTENSNLSFEQARNISFKKFGICGFNDIVVERQKALHKKYWLLIWHYYKDYFKLPKIVLSILLILSLYQILDTLQNKTVFITISFILVTVFPLIIGFYNLFKMKKRERVTQRKWLFENVTYTFGGLLFAIQIPFQVFGVLYRSIDWTPLILFLTSIVIISLGFFYYIAIKIIPQKMKETLSVTFPEYKLSAKA